MLSIRDKYTAAARDTRQVSRDYWTNTAFLAGRQWLNWDTQRKELVESMEQDGRVRLVVNRMAANHRTIISALTKREMEFEVMPNGADDASIHSAYIATEILYHLHAQHNWENVRERFATAILKGGTAAIAVDWDEDRQDTVETVLSIAEFVVEPGARNPEHARWWIKAQLLNPKEVQSIYKLDEPPRADAADGLNPLSRQLLSVHTGEPATTPLTLVLTYYERPNKLNEKGGFIVEVGGEVLQHGDWPFGFTDRLNLVVGIETASENRWFGETAYTHARPMQVAFNYAKSNLAEHLRDAATSRMLVPHSAVRLMESLNDIPGYMHPYPDGLEKPAWMSPAQLPAWLQHLPDDLARDIDDQMGVHDVTRGVAPASLESGTALSILAEMDGSPVARILKEIAECFTRKARMELQILEENSGPKRVSVIETQAGPLAIQWTGKDIGGQYNAKVPLESIIPRSRAQQELIGQKMLEMGLLTSVAEYAAFVQMPNRRDIMQVVDPNASKAQREHSRFAQGTVVTPAKFDNHETHIAEHNKFRLTVAYEMLSEMEMEAVDLHIQTHETLAAEAAAMMAQRATQPGMAGVPSANNDPKVELPPEEPPPPPQPQPPEAGPPLPPDMMPEGLEALI